MIDALVVGGGIAGLGSALALSRRGRRVVLLERDPKPPPADADGMWREWPRPGLPQGHHIHGFLARSRTLLKQHAPDVVEAMLAVGVGEQSLADRAPDGGGRPGDELLVTLRSRRPVFEGVLRRVVEAEPNVELRAGSAVAGLVVDRTGSHRVVGVRLRSDEELRAETVVDASGRTSRVLAWLAEAGAPAPHDESCDSGLVYYNRYFQLRPGAEPPPARLGPHSMRGDLPYLGYAAGLADNRAFVWNLVVPAFDRELRLLRHDDAWMAAARALPAAAPWVKPERAEPLDHVQSMGGLRCVLRRFVVDGRPVAPGLHVIGDALVHTTPTFGYGASLALTHAYALADALDAHADPAAQALAFDAAVWPEARRAYNYAVASDAARVRGFRGNPQPENPYHFAYTALPFATARDGQLFRAWARQGQLVDPPGTLLENERLMARAREIVAELRRSGELPEHPPGPTREEMVTILSHAAGAAARPEHAVAG